MLAALLVFAAVVLSVSAFRQNEQAAAGRAPGNASVAAPPAATGPSMQPTSQWAQRTADLLAGVDSPGRDLISITQRIKLGGEARIPSLVNATRPDYAVGTRHKFNVADMVQKNYYTIDATVRLVTEHAYWYVKDGYNIDLRALERSARQFEQKIYPTSRRVFGSEPSPGIDNDPRITVLLAPIPSVNGYFSSADTYPRIVNPFSNEREMIYIASKPRGTAGSADNDFEGTLAHELQHMIHFNVHRDRDVWLDEGCSEVAVKLSGYDPAGFDYLFTTQPDLQLNAWSNGPGESAPHYGASYLFLRYLMDRYGGEKFMSQLVSEEGLGSGAIDSAIKVAGNAGGFEGAFKDWIVANTLNNSALAGGKYSYAEGGRAQISRVLRSYPATRSDTVHQYAADYIKLTGNLGPAMITFKGSATAKVVAADPHSGQGYWYSNRRDSGDARLTRELDLTSAHKATLQFWTWYSIEDDFDYAYLMVSTDGGKTWAPQRGQFTTTANPNGASFGHAWTGKSGVAAGSRAAAKWVQESMDLSAYAGKRVLIRFEYITDEGYNAPGFAVDDIRVPEIGYSDNAESDNGWHAEGFVRIGNAMPQRWYVALLENGSTPGVREMVVSASGTGTLDLQGIGRGRSVRDATLVIAPLAPKTTEVANYTVTIRRK
jgi:hypothetical protein